MQKLTRLLLWHRKGGARSGARSAPLEILGGLRNSRSPFYVKDHSPPTTHPTHALRALCLALFALRAPHNAPMRYAPRITPMRYAPRKPLPRVERVSPLNVEDTSVHTISRYFAGCFTLFRVCFVCDSHVVSRHRVLNATTNGRGMNFHPFAKFSICSSHLPLQGTDSPQHVWCVQLSTQDFPR